MSAPLSSLRILDFSTLLPGPFASMLLADLGAEVLRIESTNRPDLVRMLRSKAKGGSATHATLNRSKHSLALNLKHPDAVKIVQQCFDPQIRLKSLTMHRQSSKHTKG